MSDEEPESEVEALEVRPLDDGSYGLVVVMNSDPGPDESKGFWVYLERFQLEKLIEDAQKALAGQKPATPLTDQDADELQPRRRTRGPNSVN